jgi:hypothetical protein
LKVPPRCRHSSPPCPRKAGSPGFQQRYALGASYAGRSGPSGRLRLGPSRPILRLSTQRCGAILYFDHAGQLLASGACALSPGGDAKLRGPFALSAAAQAALTEQERWQPPAFEALAEAGARSTAWLHPSEFGDALGARAAPYGGFAFTDGEGGEGGGVYFCLEPPLGSARLCLEGDAPPHCALTLRERFALPALGSTNLLGLLGFGPVSSTAEAEAAQGGDAGGAQERQPGSGSLALDTPISFSVLDLKRQIAREWHVPTGAQRLTIPALLARELRDDDTLAASGCEAGAVYEVNCAPPSTL